MSTHYFIDYFGSTSYARVQDVRTTISGQSVATGSMVIRVPDSIPIAYSGYAYDVLSQKHTGQLAQYPGYTNIVYDDLLDTSGIDLGSSRWLYTGKRGAVSLRDSSSFFRTLPVVLNSTPTQAIFAWEAFGYDLLDFASENLVLTYSEANPGLFSALVSFDGGATYISVNDGTPFQIPVGQQGSTFVIQISGYSSRLNLGAWSLVY